MCGFVGMLGSGDVAPEIHFALQALQHRGQDSAGIATMPAAGDRFIARRGLGRVTAALNAGDLASLAGRRRPANQQANPRALAFEKAGAVAIVLENIVSELASEITNELKIPTIGIGSGIDCNGQIRVIHDITGFFPWFTPSFADPLCNIANEISSAVEKYIKSI